MADAIKMDMARRLRDEAEALRALAADLDGDEVISTLAQARAKEAEAETWETMAAEDGDDEA